ncbi:hypothetical protein PFLmoz3_06361 [Pseudomonas fluorescens]|uniref:Uncharacterized protein n=1 Tax=Pseudomonas fluorescens TaxID=294 RepID=A0A120FV49_PSEFL|nr:hypothetical protein PFLmoz3_06361 [Pseudomonas fluorescens]
MTRPLTLKSPVAVSALLAAPPFAAWPLRRNRPFWLVGKLKPGKVTGLTWRWARSGGSCAVIAGLTVEANTSELVLRLAAGVSMWVALGRMTLLSILEVALTVTAPAA